MMSLSFLALKAYNIYGGETIFREYNLLTDPRDVFVTIYALYMTQKALKVLEKCIYRHAPIFSHWSWWVAPPCTPLRRFMMLSSTFRRVPDLVNRISGLPAFLAVAPAMYLIGR